MKILYWPQFLICAATISYCSLFHLSPTIAAPEISATATSTATNLPIIDTGSNTEILQVANLQVSTNASNGLKLTITPKSLNKTGGAQIPIQFLAIPSGNTQPNPTDFTTPATTNYEYTISTSGSADLDLYIKYTPGQLQDPGNYTTDLELSVADNP
jgi:hypothetical protein